MGKFHASIKVGSKVNLSMVYPLVTQYGWTWTQIVLGQGILQKEDELESRERFPAVLLVVERQEHPDFSCVVGFPA